VDLSDIPAAFPFTAHAGKTLENKTVRATNDDIVAALKSVQDPELMLNIYELGLIYDIKQLENGDVKILMTLTSPTCPVAGDMPVMVANAVATVPGVGEVDVELTFDPPWTVDRLSEDLRLIMGI
jgi:FeS assembly SUF system protein